MTLRFFTIDEQIAAIESVIHDTRKGRCVQSHRLETLKSIAVDLRARRPGEADTALKELQRRLADAAAARTVLGWDINSLRGIAEQVIGHWPVIRQSLERFESEAES